MTLALMNRSLEQQGDCYAQLLGTLQYWADPGKHRAAEINRNDGGRRVYFEDPDGHLLEVTTRPYGSGS